MVPPLAGLVFAHGGDPSNLPPTELFGNWALAIVTLLLTGGMARLALQPVFEEAETRKERSELAGWTAISLGLLLLMGAWITRQSVVEAVSPPAILTDHQHAVYHGGVLSMWGDYHAELARVESGEFRMWLTDNYRRPISSEFFSGTIRPRNAKTGVCDESAALELDDALDSTYRFAVLDRKCKSVEVRLTYPGGTITLDYQFDQPGWKRTMKDWCGT